MSKREYKAGDIVSIRGQVVRVEGDEVTIELADKDRKGRYNVTLNGVQVTDAVTFVEKGELPEPDAPFDPFASMTVEVGDTIAAADKGR